MVCYNHLLYICIYIIYIYISHSNPQPPPPPPRPPVALDLTAAAIRFTPLGPARLREALRADHATQSVRLRGRYELLLPLLRYCLSDLARASVAAQGEFVRRKVRARARAMVST